MEIAVGFEWAFFANKTKAGSPEVKENCEKCGFNYHRLCRHIPYGRCNCGVDGYFDVKVCRCIGGDRP